MRLSGGVSPRFALAARRLRIDYQIHGYAAQGFVLSSHNDFFGDSTDGSFDYYEAGINAAVQVQPNLTFAVQAAVRDAGISDDGAVRLDYAVADYRVLSEATAQAGLRAGKVKNPLGSTTRPATWSSPGRASCCPPFTATTRINAA